MADIDARQDLAGAVNALLAEVRALRSESYFRGHPWRIPEHGRRGTLHPFAVWKEWTSRPEADRRAEWDAMNAVDRRRARGVA